MARKSKNAPIKPRSASTHNAAPLTLINPLSDKPATIGLDYMTYEQLDEFGRELDTVRQRVLDDLGQKDADYIRGVIKAHKACEVLGRIGILMPFFWPAFVAGIILLAVAKILDNMEIGHNVMHGQYDWMNDPTIDASRYEWDNVSPSKDWKHGHNFVHHTYTNIHGMDRDIGYNLFRIDDDQPWYATHRFNLPLAFVLMLVFEWGIMYHGIELDHYLQGKMPKEEFQGRKKRALKKIRKQLFKDYVAWPAVGLLAVPFFGWWAPLAILGANFAANVIRNVWTFIIIFCGHFPAEVHTFAEEDAQNENRGQWYLRQLLGSANITGRAPFHMMTGNLSYQIEHHLFPDIPARRYPEVAEDVKLLVEKYGLQYNTGRLSKQMSSVIRQLAKFGRKPSDPLKVGNSPESKALRRAKREEAARRQEALDAPQLTS